MIASLIQKPESKTLEFKRDLSSPRPWLKTLVAFANSAGGKMVFGVTDDRQIIGVESPLDQEERIANLIADPEGHGVPRWFLNRQRDYKEGKNLQVASNILETKLREDVERLFKIRSNRGLRHKWGLKVRGQHTKTTGRR